MMENKYTESEIFEKLDEWFNEENENRNKKKYGFYMYDDKLTSLKQKFMTSQEFRKAIEKAGLVGFEFN